MKTALVTGSAGFIGFHVSQRLLSQGWRVIGLDCMSDYYDVGLKNQREQILLAHHEYFSIRGKVEKPRLLETIFEKYKPHIVIHLAAQAGVRYSIQNPRAYLESNITGTFELLDAAKNFPPMHLLLASTSSAYGANLEMPYSEHHRADHQVSFYAATKKSTEHLAHSYSYLHSLPITMFRFFTVYGPWGRPDMAYFKFVAKILNGDEIEIYNNGNMERDFTFVDDLVESVVRLIKVPPEVNDHSQSVYDGSSHAAPFRVVNIGNSRPVSLLDFVNEIEIILDKRANKKYLPMQAGDVRSTWASNEYLKSLTGYTPNTTLSTGLREFVKWYLSEYQKN